MPRGIAGLVDVVKSWVLFMVTTMNECLQGCFWVDDACTSKPGDYLHAMSVVTDPCGQSEESPA